ncbi:FAD-dependent oxidoreductase [Streptomyces sp. 4N509B]|uniref:FAD-dependent oxidoreductase n=1 Tax=Streptomyces sp. 4N509B TaxID=3457413 RepID=UPI003FD5276F
MSRPTTPDGRGAVAVIGAGPAGATAAYALAKKNVEVHLYEASPWVGGMSRSLELWGQTVDLGPHRFFSSDPRVNRLWLEVVGRDYQMVDRLTRVFFRNKFYPYPLKAAETLRNLGVVEAARCLASYARERVTRRHSAHQDAFDDWVVSRFGKRLYQHFFKTYTEKLWGIPAGDLDAEFAAQRIKKFSLGEAVRDVLRGGGSQRHATLVDQFAYPRQGTGVVYDRMAAHVASHGGSVHLRTPIDSLVTTGKRVRGVRLASGEVREYDAVISSMPLTLLVGRLADVPDDVREACASLTFRNTVLVYLQIDEEHLFRDNWIYVHSSELRTGRITNFRNWAPSINQGKPHTILALEYWCFDEDEFWRWDDARYVSLAKEEIARTKLVRPDQILDGKAIRLPRCYPVYRRGYREQLKVVEDFLRGYENLEVIGRYGAFKYNNQDHSILMGMLAAENVAGDGARHDLWEINSDYEYQESSAITETGLVEHERKR